MALPRDDGTPAPSEPRPFGWEGIHVAAHRLLARVAGGRLGDRFAAYALAAPDLVVYLVRLLRDERVPRSRRGEILASALYLASPIDLVPEALFGPIGLVDDALVAARLFDVALNKVEPEIVRELWPGDRAVLESLQGVASEARKVFSGGLRRGLRVLARRGGQSVLGWLGALGLRLPFGDARPARLASGRD